MNKRRMRRCHEGKQRFATLAEAQAAAASLVRRRAQQGQPIVTWMRAYGCACGGFHFGRTGRINWDAVSSHVADAKAR